LKKRFGKGIGSPWPQLWSDKMARFFVTEDSIKNDQAVITGPDVKHITRVLRLGHGDKVGLCARDGREFTAEIIEISNSEVVCGITAEVKTFPEPPVKVTLYQGLPKGDKMELVIQKSTELGVSRIVPVICARTIVKLDETKAAVRRTRWQRLAEEAAKQSRRAAIPEVAEPLVFDKALTELSGAVLAVMPWEEEHTRGIGDLLKTCTIKTDPGTKIEVAVFIGPEGGFSKQEAELAGSYGVFRVSLGPRIMRTETAGIVTVALILYELGDLGGADNG